MTSTKAIEYLITKEIKRGKNEFPKKFTALRKAFVEHFGIAPINFFFEILLHNNKPRLQPIFDKTSELKKLTNEYGYHEFNNKIIKIFIGVYGANNEYPTDDLFIICSAFDQLSIFDAHLNIPEDILETSIQPLVKNFWCVQKHHTVRIFVFSHYESDILHNIDQLEKVQKIYFDLLSSYDEFNYLDNFESQKVFFDSKENFDKKYNSSWRNYFDR